MTSRSVCRPTSWTAFPVAVGQAQARIVSYLDSLVYIEWYRSVSGH